MMPGGRAAIASVALLIVSYAAAQQSDDRLQGSV